MAGLIFGILRYSLRLTWRLSFSSYHYYVDLLFREFLPSFNLIPFGTFLQLIK